ncbi:hypothetical protein J7K74_01215 [Candidatus Woesearchaeota archaeon]|nr:hypothetical protein [Candidatus Woesearchaeota archaeon]
MKCAICGKRIGTTFMNKILGTYVYKNGKKYAICSDCQRIMTIEEIMDRL